MAGLTVGLTVIPQGIAYAIVAGLEPQYGLYSAFMGCFVYFVFGSCKDITIGPTAIMSLMVQIHVANLGPAFAMLSAFLAGCIILVLGLLNLGKFSNDSAGIESLFGDLITFLRSKSLLCHPQVNFMTVLLTISGSISCY